MEIKSQRLGLTLCLTAVIALAGLTACRSSGNRTAGRVMDDRAVNRHVKGALDDSTMYKFTDVRVQTYDGIVQLSGFVDSQDQRARAAEIAATVPGVHQVVNSLTLKPQETISAPVATTTGNPTGQRLYDADAHPPTNPNTNPHPNPNPNQNPAPAPNQNQGTPQQ